MTRINLINPSDLTDQHLIAEYRELPRIFGLVRDKLSKNQLIVVGKQYKMGEGHVRFFYDKLGFLEDRYYSIVEECKNRGFNIKFSKLDLSDIPEEYKNNYIPKKIDIDISNQRIQEKISQKHGYYKKYGKLIN